MTDNSPVSSLKYFQHNIFEVKVIDEDDHYFFLQAANERDQKKYLIKKNQKNKMAVNQVIRVSAVPILSEQGVELYDVKIK